MKGKKKRICVAQINYRSKDIQGHLKRMKEVIWNHKGFDLVVFPELILHGHPSYEIPEGLLYRKMKIVTKSVSQDLYRFVQQVKARVIIGELKRWGDRYYNMATYIDKDSIQSYTKTHVHWTENFVRGRELKPFDTPFGKVGATICFDAAFSEVWRVLTLKGARIIVNISAVPRTFPAAYMWRRLTGAAIFNQVYVIYANRPGPSFSGHSAVFNPRGEKLISAGYREKIITTEMDLRETSKWRGEEPLFPYRRPLLYRQITNRHASPGLKKVI